MHELGGSDYALLLGCENGIGHPILETHTSLAGDKVRYAGRPAAQASYACVPCALGALTSRSELVSPAVEGRSRGRRDAVGSGGLSDEMCYQAGSPA